MKITRDEYAKSYVIEVDEGCYYWNPPIESRLNQEDGAIEAAPSQEPVPIAVLDQVVRQQEELNDAAAQIAYLERSDKAAWRKANEHQKQIAKLQAEIATLEKTIDGYVGISVQIDQLQAENAELRQALVHYDFCTDVPQQAVAAIDAVLSGVPPSELSDERIRELIFDHTGLTLRDGDSYREIKNLVRAVLAEGRK